MSDVEPEETAGVSVPEQNSDAMAARIREAIGGEKVHAFAKRAGIRDSLLRKYLAGSVPGMDRAAAIAKAADMSLVWLATGEGPKRIVPGAGTTDAVLMGALVDGLRGVYRDQNARIPDIELGRQAARHHDEICAVTADPERRREMVALVLLQEKRRILEVPSETSTSKRSA